MEPYPVHVPTSSGEAVRGHLDDSNALSVPAPNSFEEQYSVGAHYQARDVNAGK